MTKENNKDLMIKEKFLKIISEYVFTFLPIIIILIILIYQRKAGLIFSSPEWSMISCILFGQIIIKAISVSAKLLLKEERMVLYITLLICVGLIPSIIILTLSFINQEEPISWIVISQFVYFILSSITYLALGRKFESLPLKSKIRKDAVNHSS